MAQKRINNGPCPNPLWTSRERKFYYSSASYLWIIGLIMMVILSCYCDSVQAFHLPEHIKRELEAEAQAGNRNEPEGDGADLTDPEIGHIGYGAYDDRKYDNSRGEHAIRNANGIAAMREDNQDDTYVRESRAATYIRRTDDGDNIDNRRRHYDQIPSSRSQIQNGSVRRGTSPLPDLYDEDDFESLEANREAFMEMLEHHAKHPHRRRSFKRHNTKLHLKYDFENKRYSITEDQSDEW